MFITRAYDLYMEGRALVLKTCKRRLFPLNFESGLVFLI